jgi:phospholipid/cholesterol/gamma-HCH transport system permease protein
MTNFVQRFLDDAGRFAYFCLMAGPAVAVSFRRPRQIVQQLHQVYAGAMPLAAVTGVALGAVIWMHLHGVLARSGPGYTRLLPEYLALAVVLEFAPLAAGFIVAGRSGASLGAELSSMRLTEQTDALEALGVSPFRYLVAPRIAACMLALPLLTVLIAALAILGSFAAEWVGGTMAWTEYWTACLRDLRVRDIVSATLKTVVFGFFIGAAGCYSGMTAAPGAEGVGRAATRGVVLSILAVVISDVVAVRVIQLLG